MLVIMKSKIYFLVLCLLCFQIGTDCIEDSLEELLHFTPRETVSIYAYTGHVDTQTTACNDSLARWTISANLTLQYGHGYITAKLDDVKTSLFNGNISNLHLVQEKEIPEKANILQQPFIIKNVYTIKNIYLKPDEPLWSINMKRGIANILNFYTTVNSINFNETTSETLLQQSLFGNCATVYTAQPSDHGSLYKQTFTGSSCTHRPMFQMINTNRAPGITNTFDVLDFESEKTLMQSVTGSIFKAWSSTNATYRSMPGSEYTQTVTQGQTITLITSEEVETIIDTTLYTDERNIIYEFPDDPSFGRHEQQRLPHEQAEEFMKNYDIFAKSFFERPVENYNVSNVDPVDEMFLILMSANNEDLTNILNAMMENKTIDNTDMLYIYFSMLPYIGSNETVKYLKDYLINNVTSGVEGAFLMQVFATIPRHIQNPTDETLLQLEPLMNWANVEQQSVRNSASLSFAAAVGHGCKRDMVSKKFATRYVDLYHKQFLEGENYNDRATNLLGLINMAQCLDEDLINSIATNTSESSHIRALAITGFKNTLINIADTIYEIYWPIVQKHSEPFEVRVAALDLLLSAYLTEEQSYSIIAKYNDNLNEPEDKQLANYLLTTLHSIQNTTGYVDNLGALASVAINNTNIPPYPKSWATGLYRLSYTDSGPSVGASFQTRLITDPRTNIPNEVQFTFNHFAMSYDFGTYNLHLKFDGLFDYLFTEKVMRELSGVSSVPELLDLLKENNFELNTPQRDVHIDIILFFNDVAVYINHVDSFEKPALRGLSAEFEEIWRASKYISYPVMDYVHIPSELGTPITLSNYLQDVSKKGIEVEDTNYRSSWYFQTWLEAYNPLVDANIASYKYYVDEMKVDINAQLILDIPYMTWINKNDTYVQFWDNMMGTAVEEEHILKEYCQECEAYNELPTEEYMSHTTSCELLGFDIEVERSSYYEKARFNYYGLSEVFDQLVSSDIHQWNADALPIAAPLLIRAHETQINLWLDSELSRGSYRSRPIRNEENETETVQTLLTINADGNFRNRFNMVNRMDFTAEIKNRDVENEILLNYGNLSYTFVSSLDGTNNIAFHQTCDMKFSSQYNSSSARITATRDVYLPGIQSDRLSLVPSQEGNGSVALISCKNIEDDDECEPHRGIFFTEVFTASDRSEILKDPIMEKDYDQCLSDSKNLKYTAATSACTRISSRLTEYDNYKIFATSVRYTEDDHNVTETKKPWLAFSRSGEDRLNIAQLSYQEEYQNLTVYYPRGSVNPLKLAYNNRDIPIPSLASSTCTITPSSVEQFSGKYIPNRNKEWLAFAECHESSTKGLVGHTIDENHVGFIFYSSGNTVSATVKDGQAQIKINGTIQNEYYDPFDHLRVFPIDDNVIHVRDLHVDIYYNTEYISVQVKSMYDNLLCGLCTQNN